MNYLDTLKQIIGTIASLVMVLSSNLASINQDINPSTQLAQVSAPTSGLVGHWKFDEGSGTTASDSSGNGNDGTLTNGPTWATGKIGGAIQLDGSNDYITGTGTSLLNVGNSGNITISAWVNPSSLPAGIVNIFTKGESASCFNYGIVISNGMLTSRNGFANYSLTGTVPTNQWTHVAVTFSSGGATGYINGASVGSNATSTTTSCAKTNFAIGVRAYNNLTEAFPGSIDEVRIYNRSLSAQEILDIYNDTGSVSTSPTPLPPAGGDTTAPVISSITSSSITTSGATVSWTTDEASDTQVEYGTTLSYGSSSALNSLLVTSHSVNLSSLSASTTYHFRAKSVDSAGNVATSADYTFTTQPIPPPVIFSFGSSLSNITEGESTTLSWSVSGANFMSIDQGVGTVTGSSASVSPTQTTTYTFSAGNVSGTTTAQTTINVSPLEEGSTIIPNISSDPVGPSGTLATFSITERFGVSHPDQIIDFDYSGPYYSNMYMETGGVEVPMQRLSNGKIAVRTSLAANQTKTFTLKSGRNPAVADPNAVVLTATASSYEITNGIAGVRLTKGTDLTLSPIQGIRMQNGEWTAMGPNKLYRAADGPSLNNPSFLVTALTAKTEILENGPLKTTLKVSYTLNRPDETVRSASWCAERGQSAPCTNPGGTGYYYSTISMEAGQPSVLIEDDSDTALGYYLDTYDQLQPNQWRYRGHVASTYEFGHEADGQVYRIVNQRPPMDAFRDIDYSVPIYSSYTTANEKSGAYKIIKRISAWDMWAPNTGKYWMAYNKDAGNEGQALGIYAGQASRAIGAHNTGPGVFSLPSDGAGKKVSGFTMQMHHGGPDLRYYPKTRVSWAIFVGSKADQNFSDPYTTQKIGLQHNIHGGINLNKAYRYITQYPDPAGGYGAMFMEASVLQNIITKLRQGCACNSDPYWVYLYNAESTARPLIDMWADKTGAKTKTAAAGVVSKATDILNTLVNKEGIFAERYHYIQGGFEMSRQAAAIDSVLADPLATASDKAAIKDMLALFGYILYDEDFVPATNYAVNLLPVGSGNMPLQHAGYRAQFALMAPEHPYFKPFIPGLSGKTLTDIRGAIQGSGASISSPHYSGASFHPLLNSALQLKQAGQDLFAQEPRLTRAGEFFMQLFTPPEVRFGKDRLMIAVGDGSTEGSATTGLLATGFRHANPALAARLMGAWTQGGKAHSGFFGTTLVQINENAQPQDPQLKSDNFLGYMSVLRNGWGTDNETAAWLINGGYYDHRHDERGVAVLYALKAPLSLPFGSIYYPHIPGATSKSMVVPESNFSFWNQDSPSMSVSSGWNSSTNDQFASFANSAFANAKMNNLAGLNWERKTYSIHANESLPIVFIADDFSGSNVAQGKVMSLNLMAEGAVQTPSGAITPASRLSAVATVPSVLPSASQTMNLSAGLNKFSFTGQTWEQHPTKGIDFDVYTVSNESQQAILGNWGHSYSPLSNAYRIANGGKTFAEQQHILRVRGTGSFKTLILPWKKGQKPQDLAVTQSNGDTVITRTGETIRISDAGYSFKDSTKTILTSFSSSSLTKEGITISGGPTEVSLTSNTATSTFHGPAGTRTLTLPGVWVRSSGIGGIGTTYTYNYSGGDPVTVTMSGVFADVSPSPLPPPPAPAPAPTPSPTPSPSTKFILGQKVQTTDNLNVRSLPSTSGTVLGTQLLSSLGTILSGGQSADGFFWWNVNYDSGADGWSVENFLRPYISPVNISDLSIMTGSTTATVTWNTDKSASTKIEYGLLSSLGYATPEQNQVTGVLSHSITLDNLKPCSQYHYRSVSIDVNGNVVAGSKGIFATKGCPGNADILSEATTLLGINSGGSLSLTTAGRGISLSVPQNFAYNGTQAFFQAKQLAGTSFIQNIALPLGKTAASNHVYQLDSFTAPTTTVSTFAAPLSLTVFYTDAEVEGLDESTLKIYRYDGSLWHALANCSVNTTANAITCDTTQFSTFVLVGDPDTSNDPPPESSGGGSPSTGSGSSSGGGGGGSSSGSSRSTSWPVESSCTLTVSTSLPKNLFLGARGDDVLALQDFLIALGYLTADNNTSYFGYVTEAAVKAFQRAEAIVSSGNPNSTGYGAVGPTTRGRINSLLAVETSSCVSEVEVSFPGFSGNLLNFNMALGSRGDQVKVLQKFLVGQGLLTEDNVTSYFGYATEAAVKAFQRAQAIVSSGNPNSTGYGAVGPITRERINALLETTSPSSSTAPSLQAEVNALRKQAEELLLKLQGME